MTYSPKYSLADIKAAWTEFDKAMVVSVLKGGTWTHKRVGPGYRMPNLIDGTRAEIRKLSSTMGFPEFLEKEWKS
jgi:hypothetical protein